MFDVKRVLKQLEKHKAKRVFLQVPEGLKTKAQEIADKLESQGFCVFLSCEPCFGACDIRDDEASRSGCDVILHAGHTDFGVKTKIPVIYEPYEIDFDPVPLLKKHKQELKYRSVCLFTTAQFTKALEAARGFLESEGIRTRTGEHTKSGKEGQVLGCDYSATASLEGQVDCFLYLGSGLFHPLGLALKTEKPVLSLNIETGKLEDRGKEKERLERIKAFHIERAKDASTFGILLTTKPGQMPLRQAEIIKSKLESKGRKAWILVMDEITPEKLMGVDVEVLVNCACPRLDEDFRPFKKPILNPEDVDKI
jgi:2-(3-amino-3-carboxypropyl)histidine synthase